MTSVTDYLIGKALEDERTRIIAALRGLGSLADEPGDYSPLVFLDEVLAIVRGAS